MKEIRASRDCGDAGHILLSKHIAEDLEQYDRWQPYLHDLGECEVKHGVRVHLFNLYTDDVGNSELPETLKFAAAAGIPPRRKNSRPLLLLAAAGLVVAGIIAFWFTRRNAGPAANAAPEKSIAVLPFENLSRDPDNAYLSTGIQDEILTRLAKVAAAARGDSARAKLLFEAALPQAENEVKQHPDAASRYA
jgi:hypothetical protein